MLQILINKITVRRVTLPSGLNDSEDRDGKMVTKWDSGDQSCWEAVRGLKVVF